MIISTMIHKVQKCNNRNQKLELTVKAGNLRQLHYVKVAKLINILKTGTSNSSANICKLGNDNSSNIGCDDAEPSDNLPYGIMILGSVLLGIGHVPTFVLGLSYIDENSETRDSAFHMGIKLVLV